jgi:hypothetical protein
MSVGTYTGNGSGNRPVAGVGFQPDFVMTLGDGADNMFRPGTLVGTGSFKLAGFAVVANRILALEPDGFLLSNNAAVNQNGVTYHYLAFRNGAGVAQNGYAGNGVDNRTITGVGFEPVFVLAKREAGNAAALRPASVIGDLSLVPDASASRRWKQMASRSARTQQSTRMARRTTTWRSPAPAWFRHRRRRSRLRIPTRQH